MFMAEKLIITGEVKKQNNMAFKMRSGNKVSFKNMGSSPAKDMKTGSYEHSFESPAKEITKEGQARLDAQAKRTASHKSYLDKDDNRSKFKKDDKGVLRNADGKSVKDMNPQSPAKQKLNKGGEGQDQDKIFNSKGEHVGDYVNDKVVMKPGFKRPVVKKDTPVKPTDEDMYKYSDLEKYDDDRPVVKKDTPVKPKEGDMKKYSDLEKYDDDNPTGKAEPPKRKKLADKNTPMQIEREKKTKSPAKQAKTKGLGPRTAFGGVKNPELTKTKKPFSIKKMDKLITKVMKDGPKNTAIYHDGRENKDPHWQPHQFRSPNKK